MQKEEATEAKDTHLLQQVREDTNEPRSCTKNEDLFYFTYRCYPWFPLGIQTAQFPRKAAVWSQAR